MKHHAPSLTPWFGSIGLHLLIAGAAFALAWTAGEKAASVPASDGGTDEAAPITAPAWRSRSTPAIRRVTAFMPSARSVNLSPSSGSPAVVPPEPPPPTPAAVDEPAATPAPDQDRPPAAPANARSRGPARTAGKGRGAQGDRPGRGTGSAGRGTGSAGLGDGKAAYRNQAPLIYPSSSRQHGESGTVLIRIRVEADGHVSTVEIVQSSGHPALDQAALRCARSSTYRPALRAGKAVASWVEAPFRFALK